MHWCTWEEQALCGAWPYAWIPLSNGLLDGKPFNRSFRPPPHVSAYFWIRNYFFPRSKISTSTRIHFQMEFARPLAGKTKFKQCSFPARRLLFLCEELCLVTVLLWHSKTSVISRGIYCSLWPGLFDFGGFLFVAQLLFDFVFVLKLKVYTDLEQLLT